MTSPLRRHPSAALVVAVAALVVAVADTPVGSAVAGTLDTKAVTRIAKKVADKQIKRKATKLTVARARSADTADALAGVPAGSYQRKGASTFTLNAVSWSSVSPVPLTYTHWSDGTTITSTSLASHVFTYPVTVPVQLGGAAVTLTSVRYCYAASTDVHLGGESVQQLAFTNGMGVDSAPSIQNTLNLTNAGCRTIQVDRPLGANDQINLFVTATWGLANAPFRLGSVQVTVTQS